MAYINGASADPSAKIIRLPKTIKKNNIGVIHHFLFCMLNSISSLMIDTFDILYIKN